MKMQETVFSIRVWFALVGFFGTIRGVSGIFMSVAYLQDWVVMIEASITLLVGASFLYSSIKFPELVKSSTKFVQSLLYVVMALNAISAVVAFFYDTHMWEKFLPVIMIMISWYLLINVKRLEEEHATE